LRAYAGLEDPFVSKFIKQIKWYLPASVNRYSVFSRGPDL